ncbi:MAG: methyltransferase domain-containing protein [Myxococcota bacterium]
MLQLDKNGVWVGKEDLSISYPDSSNDECLKIEDLSFWFRHRNEVISSVIRQFPFENGFADIGGGNGYQLQQIARSFPERDSFLIEPGYQGCLNARSRGISNVYNMFFQNFDFSANRVGGIGLFDVIEHVDDDVQFMTQLRNHIPRGAYVYFTVPAYQFLWSDVDSAAGHFRRHTTKTMKKLAKQAGFNWLWSSYFFSYAILPLFLLRSMPYHFGRRRPVIEVTRSESENHQAGLIAQRVLNGINAAELLFINRGLKIPVGSSLIGVLQS